MKYLIFPSLLFLFPWIGSSQAPDLVKLQSDHPGENALFLERKEDAAIRIEKGELKVVTRRYDDMILLNEKGAVYNERSVYYSHFEEVGDLDARTLVPDGKGYKTKKVTGYKKQNDVSAGVFYDDQMAINFHYQDLKAGARTILSYTETLNEPRFFGIFFFGSYVHTKECEFAVRIPEGVKVKYKLFHVPDGMVTFTEKKVGKETVLSWSAREVKKIESEENSPNIRYYSPHIVIYITEYKTGNEIKPVLRDVKDLYAWYRTMVKGVNDSIDPNLRHIVDSLVTGTPDEFTRVKKIFYWVQDHIKYVAFEDGLGGFVPRQAKLVCSRRYGDCKDMASIITAMCRAAGIKAYLTWIGTRDIPYTYDEVPSPLSDNHMIATWISPQGEYYFLDATGKNAELGFHTAMIQGKEALIGISEEEFKVVTVPVKEKELNHHKDSIAMTLKDKVLSGTGAIRTRGYVKIRLGEILQGLNDDDRAKFMRSFVKKGNNKFHSDTVTLGDLHTRETDFTARYSFSLPDYIRSSEDEIYINLNIDKSVRDKQIDLLKRKTPVFFDQRLLEEHISTITLPAGYTFSFIPPDVSFQDPRFGFTLKYIQKGNTLTLHRMIYQDILLMKAEDMVTWNKLAAEINKASNESIILKKKK